MDARSASAAAAVGNRWGAGRSVSMEIYAKRFRYPPGNLTNCPLKMDGWYSEDVVGGVIYRQVVQDFFHPKWMVGILFFPFFGAKGLFSGAN